MRKFGVFAILGLGSAAALAQTAGMMSFQAVLKDGGGVPVIGAVTLELQIVDLGNVVLDANGDGVVNAADTFVVNTTAVEGVISVKYGPVAPSAFNGAHRFLKATVTNPPLPALTNVEIVTPPAIAEQLNARGTGAAAVVTTGVGNVGIGTTTPSCKLHIDGGDGSVPNEIQVSSGAGGTVVLRSPSVSNVAQVGAASGDDLDLLAGGTSRLRIAHTNGNVGLGTTTPASRLDVRSAGPAVGPSPFMISKGNGDPHVSIEIQGDDRPWVRLFQAGAERIRLDPGAGSFFLSSVGIGIANPSSRLHVVQPNSSSAILVQSNVDPLVEGPVVEMRNSTAGPGVVLRVVGDSDGDSGGPWDALVVESGGTIRGRFGLYHGPSDGRLKRDIETVPNALARVLALRGVNFRWRSPDMDGDALQLGLIAQEVEEVFPEVVHTADDGMNTKAIEYDGLTAAVVEAIKEQQREIEALQSSAALKERIIVDQQRRIDEQGARLKSQETRLGNLAERLAKLEGFVKTEDKR